MRDFLALIGYRIGESVVLISASLNFRQLVAVDVVVPELVQGTTF